jgi:cellulose biosynthesis protein BcsQ
VAGPTAPAVVLTAVAEAVADVVLIVVAVEFVAVVEAPPVDLVRLLDQSRLPSPLHGTRPQFQKSPRRPRKPNTTTRRYTRLKRLQKP